MSCSRGHSVEIDSQPAERPEHGMVSDEAMADHAAPLRLSLDCVAETDSAPSRLPPVLLSRMIAAEVIPRLARGLRAAPAPELIAPLAVVPVHVVAADVADVVALVLTEEADTVFAHVQILQGRGLSVQTIFLDLLAPVARRLGEMWEADTCDFAQVTIGLVRLQQVLRRLSPEFQDDAAAPSLALRALLMPTPGEQHTFGLVIVSEFFRRAGWEVAGAVNSPDRDLQKLVGGTWFAMAGLTLGSESRLDALVSCIRLIRAASCNRHIGIMVGGPLFLAQPHLVAQVGADSTARDAPEAVLQAHRLLNLRPGDR
jgi:methanogenic corrinoid protein MtbC1